MEKTRDWRGYIDVTDLDTRKLVGKAFDLSAPQGLGQFSHKPGPLSDQELDELMGYFATSGKISLDYVRGRSLKFHIYTDTATDKRYISAFWYDHSPEDVSDLLALCGMADPEEAVKRALRAQAERNAEPDEEDNSL